MHNIPPNNAEPLLWAIAPLTHWAIRCSRLLICLAILITILAPLGPAYAQGSSPDDPVNGAAHKLVGIFANLGERLIQIAYALMFLIFAVSSVRSGLGAQVAQLLGRSGQVSQEISSLIVGVVIFGIAIMTLPLVNMISTEISEQFTSGGDWNFEINIPVPLQGK